MDVEPADFIMKIYVVEDEQTVAQRLLRQLGGLCDQDTQFKHFSSLDDAYDALENAPPEVLFLDLNLNGEDGFELLKHAVAGSFHTIVVSAHADRAIEAFEYGVLDFLPKPFNEARLKLALERLNGQHRKQNHLRQLAVKRPGRLDLVSVASLVFIQAAGNYAELVDIHGQIHLYSKSLDHMMILLPKRFLRIHRSYIVCADHIRGLFNRPGSRYELELSDGNILPVGRTRLADVKSVMACYPGEC